MDVYTLVLLKLPRAAYVQIECNYMPLQTTGNAAAYLRAEGEFFLNFKFKH